MIDRARASDGATVRTLTKAEAIAQARAVGAFVLEGRARVTKHMVIDGRVDTEPYEVVQSEPNLFLTAGIANLWNLATGQGTPTAWDETTARLAVGTSSTEPTNAARTTLAAEISRKLVDDPPLVAGNAVTFTATFTTADANGVWNEVGVTNAASSGVFLNRLVQNFGEKTSSAQWVLSLTLSITS